MPELDAKKLYLNLLMSEKFFWPSAVCFNAVFFKINVRQTWACFRHRYEVNFCCTVTNVRCSTQRLPPATETLKTPVYQRCVIVDQQIHSISLTLTFLLLSECHEWSVAFISVYLRRGTRGCFRSECCIGGESMAALPVSRFLVRTYNAEHQAGEVASFDFHIFDMTRPGVMACVQLTVPLSRPPKEHNVNIDPKTKCYKCKTHNKPATNSKQIFT